MKGCPNWIAAIRDCALGETPDPAFAAHLDICPQCQTALRESRANVARIDEFLHRGATVDPPPYGPQRVMARIHAPAQSRTLWKWAGALASAALLLAIVLWLKRPAPQVQVTALTAWRSPTEALLRPPVAAAWDTKPRLGEAFFKIKPSGERHAQ